MPTESWTYEARRCPKCGGKLMTDGHRLWCASTICPHFEYLPTLSQVILKKSAPQVDLFNQRELEIKHLKGEGEALVQKFREGVERRINSLIGAGVPPEQVKIEYEFHEASFFAEIRVNHEREQEGIRK